MGLSIGLRSEKCPNWPNCGPKSR